MMNRSRALRVSLAAAAAAVATAAAALDPQQFVAGWPIEAPAAEVFDVPLTAEVYATAQSVGQMAVLDANSAPLPFFRRTTSVPDAVEQRLTLEASPLYAATAGGTPALGVTTSERGTSITVTPGASGDSAAVTGFVLDARAADVTPIALDLEWRELPQPFLLDVRVEQSVDLTNWRFVGGAAVAALDVAGTEARHARVPVHASAGGYYRITPARSVEGWYLERAALITAETATGEALTVRAAPLPDRALPADAVPEALYFDAGGALPVTAVAVAFPADVGWLRADVAASDSLEGPWYPAAHGALFYALRFEERAFASTPVALARRELRYWRVTPSRGARPQGLELVLTSPQEYLRVSAGGASPFMLAAGTLAEEAGEDRTFAAVWRDLDPDPEVPIAGLGVRRELGGANALRAPREFPWRAAVLWSVLVGGVLVVGFMAVRLAREMQHKPA